MPVTPEQAVRAFLDACDTELAAMKPGNVHVHRAGHGMTVEDFRTSARVAAEPLCIPPRRPIGVRIRDAVAATRAAVGCNTNLGIVLLAAPLIAAAETAPDGAALHTCIQSVLDGLTIEDAAAAYEAIRIASPAGLGSAAAQDVAAPPTVTLRAAMALAADRDRVARQYATGYEDVFSLGVAGMDTLLAAGYDPAWAAALVHMDFLASFPDSHIARKYGAATAEAVRAEAAALRRHAGPEELMEAFRNFDSTLKERGINPGTSADLTVASLLAIFLRHTLFTGEAAKP
jgi:triphosphoribosyl-dephospho-CoA synthase